MTVLRGRVADQAALHGLLARLRDLGVPLISVVTGDVPWTGAVALLLLSAVPLAAGALRLVQLAGGWR